MIHFPEILALSPYSGENALFPGIRISDVVSEVVFAALSLCLIFILNTQIFKFNTYLAKISWRRLALSFLMVFILSSLSGKLFILVHRYLDIPALDTTLHHYLHPMRDLIVACIVTGTCYMMNLILRQQSITFEIQQLRTENIRNQYEALKHQLNPHMFFNTLNTLQALTREEPQKARDYIQELSKVLRYTLQIGDSRSTTVAAEMEFTQAYIYLLKMRYEDNLDFHIDIDKELNNYHLPNISLQPLIENAINHNAIRNRHKLKIIINTDKEDNLCISNLIQSKRVAEVSDGIGLANLAQRYQLLFNREIIITRADNTFTVKIPLIQTL